MIRLIGLILIFLISFQTASLAECGLDQTEIIYFQGSYSNCGAHENSEFTSVEGVITGEPTIDNSHWASQNPGYVCQHNSDRVISIRWVWGEPETPSGGYFQGWSATPKCVDNPSDREEAKNGNPSGEGLEGGGGVGGGGQVGSGGSSGGDGGDGGAGDDEGDGDDGGAGDDEGDGEEEEAPQCENAELLEIEAKQWDDSPEISFDSLKSQFSSKFPLDMVTVSSQNESGNEDCPVFELMGRSMPACVILMLVRAAKWPILISMIIRAVFSL